MTAKTVLQKKIEEGRTARGFLALWLPVLLWMAIIFALSSMPKTMVPNIRIPYADKAAHFFEFLILGALLIRAFLHYFHNSLWRAMIPAIVIAFLYAFSDEFHQSFVPGRTADIFDLMVDVTASVIGTAIYKRG